MPHYTTSAAGEESGGDDQRRRRHRKMKRCGIERKEERAAITLSLPNSLGRLSSCSSMSTCGCLSPLSTPWTMTSEAASLNNRSPEGQGGEERREPLSRAFLYAFPLSPYSNASQNFPPFKGEEERPILSLFPRI